MSLCLSPNVVAQSPITIEQLLAKPSTWQISTSLAYRARSMSAVQQERQSGGSLGLRYGLTPRVELNARVQEWQSSLELGAMELRQHSRSFSVGGNWLVKPESSLPAVLIEARGELYRDGSDGRHSAPGGLLALTSYKSIDPLVLSLATAVTLQRDYRIGGAVVSPGVTWRIEPGVNFAVNSSVTLFGSVALERSNASYVDDSLLAASQERIGLRGGIALALAQQHSLFISGDLASDRSGGMSLQWFYEF
ncbi:hypothetical protein [Congregibacter sp.]|uniref:hypothetical protein n=1 Tax=Congregibacter sp. TaxID=2744308 RepID=UPI003F6B8AE2